MRWDLHNGPTTYSLDREIQVHHEKQHSIHHFEESNLLIQESEETEIEQLIFNIKSSFGQPMEEEINSRSTIIKNYNENEDKLEEGNFLIQDTEEMEIDQVI